jgi:hypothetical protein
MRSGLAELTGKNLITPAYPVASQVDEIRHMADAAERLAREANLAKNNPGLSWIISKIGAHLHDLGNTLDGAELRPFRTARRKRR